MFSFFSQVLHSDEHFIQVSDSSGKKKPSGHLETQSLLSVKKKKPFLHVLHIFCDSQLKQLILHG